MFGLGSPLMELDVMNSGHCPFPSEEYDSECSTGVAKCQRKTKEERCTLITVLEISVRGQLALLHLGMW